MSLKRFIIASVNQGWAEIGKDYYAYEQNTIFLSGICEADTFLDEPACSTEARAYLKNIGSLTLRLADVFSVKGSSRLANLEMDSESKMRYQAAMEFLFRKNIIGYFHQERPLMTLSPSTALKPNDFISVSYLSVIEPKGDGIYNLIHDYPLERTQGPRYEKFYEAQQ